MELSKKDKELLVRMITVYYEKEVWGKMLEKHPSKASDEDYLIRSVMDKLSIKEMLPEKIKSRL